MLQLLTALQSKLLALKIFFFFVLLYDFPLWRKTIYKVSISIPICKWAHFKAFVRRISIGLKEDTKFNVLPLGKLKCLG